MMARKSTIAACSLLALATAAALPATAHAQKLTPITISYQPTDYWALPFYVATKKGWWREVGLDPKFVLFPAGMPQMASAAANSWDVGATGAVPAVFGAARFNIETIGIANDESAANVLIASKKGYDEFKANPKKIAGQRILLTENSTVDFAVRSCLAKYGVSEDSVQLVNLGQASIVSALLAEQTELAGLWAPNSYSAEQKAGAKVLCSGKTADVTIPSNLVARTQYGKEHPNLVAAYLAVYVHSWQWAKAHPEEAAEMLKAADVQGGVPLSDYDVKQEFKRPTFSLSQQLATMKRNGGKSNVDTWMDDIGAFLEKVGSIQKAPKANTYVTDTYMKVVASNPKLKAFADSSK